MTVVERNGQHYFEYRHWVCFEETNVVGNVYFCNHVVWQGRCRERFLFEYAPDVLSQIDDGLALITLRVNCEYFQEAFAFDEIILRMNVEWIRQNRMGLRFDYIRAKDGVEEVIARGEQQTASMTMRDGRLVPVPYPKSVLSAIDRLGLLQGSRPALASNQ